MIKLDFGDDYINLDKIYDSGQVFRWTKIDDKEYIIRLDDIERKVKQNGNVIRCENSNSDMIETILRNYFDIDTDYSKFHNRLIESQVGKEYPYILEAEQAAKGIRILKQDLWETIVSFIISQNNNIPRIKKSIQALYDKYGHFPEADEIIKYEILYDNCLTDCGLGYRKRYIGNAALKWWNEQYFPELYYNTS